MDAGSTVETSRRRLVLAAGGLGVVARLRQFTVDRSLWLDEAAIAMDLDERTIVESLTEVSDRNQMAPPGFWVLEHLVSEISRTEEMLRAVPLLAGLFLVGLSCWYALRHLESLVAQLTLVLGVGLSPSLVFYATELKQYGIEALVTMGLLCAVMERDRLGRWARVAIGLGALSLSFAALPFVAVLGLAWLGRESSRVGWVAACRSLALPGGALLCAAVAVVVFVTATEPALMEGFWAGGFAPVPRSAETLAWWTDSARGLVYLAVSNVGVAWHIPLDGWHTPANRLATVVVEGLVAGAVFAVVYRRRLGEDRSPRLVRARVAIVVISGATAILIGASSVGLYPFRGRVIVHLVPLVFVAVAHSVEAIEEVAPRWVAGLARASASFVVGIAVVTAGGAMRTPYADYAIESALDWLEANVAATDVVIVHSDTEYAADYYAARDSFNGADVEVLGPVFFDGEMIAAQAGPRRAWFVHGFVNELWTAPMVRAASRHERVEGVFEAEGVMAWRLAAVPDEP